MKNKALLLFFLTQAVALMAQKGSKSFRDDFDDNKNQWPILNNEYFKTEIADGKYVIYFKQKEKVDKNYFVKYDIVSLQKPFVLEVRIKQLEVKNAEMPNTYGLVIGEKDRGNSHYFTVSQSEKVSTWYYLQMHKYALIKRMPVLANTFQKEDPAGTKFLVKFIDGHLYFYINDEFLGKLPKPDFWMGSGVGIYVSSGMKLAVDYIEMKEL
ncbi:MAG: hypothetical protein N2167_00445 [Flavobacteriales bacterium]|nr:hypothetical protein [Flavobacteriales bacterium]